MRRPVASSPSAFCLACPASNSFNSQTDYSVELDPSPHTFAESDNRPKGDFSLPLFTNKRRFSLIDFPIDPHWFPLVPVCIGPQCSFCRPSETLHPDRWSPFWCVVTPHNITMLKLLRFCEIVIFRSSYQYHAIVSETSLGWKARSMPPECLQRPRDMYRVSRSSPFVRRKLSTGKPGCLCCQLTQFH